MLVEHMLFSYCDQRNVSNGIFLQILCTGIYLRCLDVPALKELAQAEIIKKIGDFITIQVLIQSWKQYFFQRACSVSLCVLIERA